ncbi:A-factor type gamma-butyrolactone 1'-reductase (1S-forming)-like [Maniola jurtina]|uniref:A-factor type gamma-butyrolactone 1'-reductase (1S-forming)-like n=1 Tax=Maniola jurtina TaxID=191418 RepID=UPI001E68D571|nr:A-factor type gamma-butyrolactone 1'-reductase (1S-forming)-like [Maniola jurtina]
MSFTNKVVIVTGASSGIGEGTALLFAKEGANLVIIGRNDVKLTVVAARCEEYGKKPLKIIADVSKEDQAVSIIDQTINKFGKIDVLINNAGILRLGKIIDGTIMSIYDDLMNTNLRSVIHLTTIATPYLIKSKGNIINISSAGGVKATRNPLFLAYAMTKNSLNIFGQGVAIELAPYGVRVNTISPGPVYSDVWKNSNISQSEAMKDYEYKTALNRISKPEEIANLALYLAGDNAIGITGSNYLIDNGFTLMN